MISDDSAFLPTGVRGWCKPLALEQLGWGRPFFARLIDVDALTTTPPERAVAVNRSGLQMAGDGIDEMNPPGPDATVGDWLPLDRARPRSSRVLERKSPIKRRAPATDGELQLIAANTDAVFVVTSCNTDFSVARLERYVALAFEDGTEPVIVLTKADLTNGTRLRIPLIADAHSRLIADSVPGDRGHPGWVSE